MADKALATRVVDQMYNNDPFSIWLGIERVQESEGSSTLRMKVRKEMLNGFGIIHGGVTFSLADSALAFASNSHGIQSVSIDNSINYFEPAKEGDVLTATTEEVRITNKIGLYHITITNQTGSKIALFKGMVYRTGKPWFNEVNPKT
jgi:acyl-CoA thioesterase